MQQLIGCVINVKDPHKLQNINSIGLTPACSPGGTIDFVKMVSYISSCSLAILEEVEPDALTLSRIDPLQNYSFKNVYRPHFHWESHSQLAIIPPVFESDSKIITLESNGCVLMFPIAVPRELAQDILQKLLIRTIYTRLAPSDPAVDMAVVDQQTGTVAFNGRDYTMDLGENAATSLMPLDNLAIYTSILTALIPNACGKMMKALLRTGEHELMDIFRQVIPEDLVKADDIVNVEEDLVKMNAFMTYMQSLGTIFNLGPLIRIATFCQETQTAIGWCSYY